MQMNPVERVQHYAMLPTENYEGIFNFNTTGCILAIDHSVLFPYIIEFKLRYLENLELFSIRV